MAKVLQILEHSPRLYEVLVENPGLDFQPGDSTLLVDRDKITARPYCIASHPSEAVLRFLVSRITGGALSNSLDLLRVGDDISVGPCFGQLHPAANRAPKVFIATGTGIAPFLSYFGDATAPPPLALLYGVRYFADAIDWKQLQQRCPTTRLAVSAERVPDTHYGRVTDLFHSLPIATGIEYYLCGHGDMIRSATDHLQEIGITPTAIKTEKFF